MGNRIEGISRSIQHKQRELEIVQTRLSEAQKKEKARRENLQHLGTQEEKLREELDRIAREEVELAVKKEELSQAVNRLAGEGSKLSNRVHEIELQRIRLMQEEEANMETTTRQNRVTVYIHRYFWIILAIIFVAVLSVVLLFANGCSCSAKSDRAVIRITDAETAIAGSVDFSDTRRKTGIPEDSNAIGPTKRTFSADIP
ncbi:MAG: hypothetical protein Q8N88_01215, partial [Nanoarchaeota archaeon]|nr:hypothetical protein [Nanoarchaeota archaeon]